MYLVPGQLTQSPLGARVHGVRHGVVGLLEKEGSLLWWWRMQGNGVGGCMNRVCAGVKSTEATAKGWGELLCRVLCLLCVHCLLGWWVSTFYYCSLLCGCVGWLGAHGAKRDEGRASCSSSGSLETAGLAEKKLPPPRFFFLAPLPVPTPSFATPRTFVLSLATPLRIFCFPPWREWRVSPKDKPSAMETEDT